MGPSSQYCRGHVTLVFCASNQKFVTISYFLPMYLKFQDYMTYISWAQIGYIYAQIKELPGA